LLEAKIHSWQLHGISQLKSELLQAESCTL